MNLFYLQSMSASCFRRVNLWVSEYALFLVSLMTSLSLILAVLFIALHSFFSLSHILQWESVLTFGEQASLVAVCPMVLSYCIFGGAMMIQSWLKKAKKKFSAPAM